jgi:DNA-binding transcriptional ArsR family regulator
MDQTFMALSDQTRRNILEMLSERGALAAGDIYAEFDATAPAISQHLKVLREANLVNVEKRAQQRIYSVNAKGLDEMERWIREMRRFWNERFDMLDAMFKAQNEREQDLKKSKVKPKKGK